MEAATNRLRQARTGWTALLARLAMGTLLFEVVTGLAITWVPFHAAVQWGVLSHTLVGAAALLPVCWYVGAHWAENRRQALSDVVLLGYAGTLSLLICLVSGIVVTWQGFFGLRVSPWWRNTHLISTLAAIGCVLPHIVVAFLRRLRAGSARPSLGYFGYAVGITVVGVCLVIAAGAVYSGTRYVNAFPKDYSFLFGQDRPFAPSLARTSTGGAFDARSLSGSESCGTPGCHQQILDEWRPSAHRYAAMDSVFQGIQAVMARQNGPESTRYCAGCHDPISLFSGTKNIFVEDLTNLQGYQEGVSCLSCHSIQRTDVQGNANFIMAQPREYLFQWADSGLGRVARDFLIRTYPAEHNRLNRRMYKTPEFCAACHKQFIDQEVNRVGWVQLQNQYDNWAASHWNHSGDPEGTLECRECHMPLTPSHDPASGDASDYNREPDDRKHRSHRFLAANNFMPALLKLEGWENHARLTEKWLRGEIDVPEIRDKWAQGAIVNIAVEAPDHVRPGDQIPIRVILSSNKVGHDFPTGPLDMIQSWVEISVEDEVGNILFASGRRDRNNFIEPGTFLFKAEPVDQYGNLIDRHNLWEMVGVRFRRSLFPGYSDTVEYVAACPSGGSGRTGGGPAGKRTLRQEFKSPPVRRSGTIAITARLLYRKVDQFLLNYVLGQRSGATAPVVQLALAAATVKVGEATEQDPSAGSD